MVTTKRNENDRKQRENHENEAHGTKEADLTPDVSLGATSREGKEPYQQWYVSAEQKVN